jgi:hypothetical protein
MIGALTVGQLKPAPLQRTSTGSGLSPPISRSATFIGTLASRSAARTLLSISSISGPNTSSKQFDVLVTVVTALQRLDALLARAVLDRFFEFRNKREVAPTKAH